MSAIYLLIAASFVVAAGFLAAFMWSVKNGQYEDSYSPSVRILFDDKLKQQESNKSTLNKPQTVNNQQ